jgi:transcriptional regulator with XRE-family HTH domain
VSRTPSSSKTRIALSQVFGVRLRQAREGAGMSQEALASKAGFDEFSASARISQYETGKHLPRYEIACKLADALSISVAFLYADDDKTAQLLHLWQNSSVAVRQQVLKDLALANGHGSG